LPWRIIFYQTRLRQPDTQDRRRQKFHKADDTATQTATATLETPMANRVDKEEGAPHKREETMEILDGEVAATVITAGT
jgi:hypothetical protein